MIPLVYINLDNDDWRNNTK